MRRTWGFAHGVKKFDNTGEETDDLISIGTVGLIKAIGTFKPDKGTRLATYAARCIENERLLTNPVLGRASS
jgi:RNA polymerase sporulation-specific sigma factor